jgi:hypothetical protein
VRDNLAYVANGQSGVVVLEVSNPARITKVAAYDTAGMAVKVKVTGNLIYVADYGSGVSVLEGMGPLFR